MDSKLRIIGAILIARFFLSLGSHSFELSYCFVINLLIFKTGDKFLSFLVSRKNFCRQLTTVSKKNDVAGGVPI